MEWRGFLEPLHAKQCRLRLVILRIYLQGATLVMACHRDGVMVTGECEPPR